MFFDISVCCKEACSSATWKWSGLEPPLLANIFLSKGKSPIECLHVLTGEGNSGIILLWCSLLYNPSHPTTWKHTSTFYCMSVPFVAFSQFSLQWMGSRFQLISTFLLIFAEKAAKAKFISSNCVLFQWRKRENSSLSITFSSALRMLCKGNKRMPS